MDRVKQDKHREVGNQLTNDFDYGFILCENASQIPIEYVNQNRKNADKRHSEDNTAQCEAFRLTLVRCESLSYEARGSELEAHTQHEDAIVDIDNSDLSLQVLNADRAGKDNDELEGPPLHTAEDGGWNRNPQVLAPAKERLLIKKGNIVRQKLFLLPNLHVELLENIG